MKSQLALSCSLLALLGVSQVSAQTVNSVLTNGVSEPYGVVVVANTYYLTDSANHRIVSFVPDSGAFSTLAGFIARPGAVDGKGVYARFYNPRGLISAPSLGGLVVADYGNHTLRLVKLDGTTTTLAGTPGVPGLDNGLTPALQAHFNFPSALAADTNGNIFIADSKNNAIRKLDVNNNVSTVATGFNQPTGIAVGDNGDLWVADSRDQTIKQLLGGVPPAHLAAGTSGQSGALDSMFATQIPGFDVPGALFNNPGALLWLGGGNGLLVCDSGNDAIRRVFQDPEIIGYSVATYAGTLGQSGYVDGPVLQAKFNTPSGITSDSIGGFLIADLANNALRDIQTSAPQPPVSDPVIGWVSFQKDSFGDLVSQLVPVTQSVFNNDVTIAIKAETGTATYFTYGPTPASSLQDTIPSPNQLTGNSPPFYEDGLHQADVPPSIIQPQPDVTIKVISTASNRKASDVVLARFQFQTGNPSILGDNPASFVVTNITFSSQMWYTTDGSDPAMNGPTSTLVPSGGTINLPRSATNIPFRVIAYRTDYSPSQIVNKTFLSQDYLANRISLGFESGEASSDFVASPGQIFYAPVTLSLLPGQTMYTLQFNLTVTNLNGSPPVAAGAVGFQSMLKESFPNNVYKTIPPAMTYDGNPIVPPNLTNGGLVNLPFTNSLNNFNLLGVGWLERAGETNLYTTTKQDLISYSIAHDTVFRSANQEVVVGGYIFGVPPGAVLGNLYQIQVARPSATSDGIGQDNFIEAVTDGSLTSTPTNLINSIKWVTIGQRSYIVGDVTPFRWFNAGDFGKGYILNNDVVQVFQSAIYALDYPPPGSDFFDAMDSSNGSTNGIFFGNDLSINNIKMGDGQLNVDDVYVTFRRSLDPTLTWYMRYWQNGSRTNSQATNNFRGSPDLPGQQISYRSADQPGGPAPSVVFAANDQQVSPGQTIQVPIRSKLTGNYPLRVLMLNLTVEPLDGSPALTQPVQFTPVNALGTPTLTATRGGNNFAGAWLNSQGTGVTGDAVVGQLTITIPTNAPSSAAYRVHFDHASASPNGLALFPKLVQDGLLLLQDRSASSPGDGIPDTWRLRYFGSISNPLAQANVDADGDGASNWAEFQAGTNPMDPHSYLGLRVTQAGSGASDPLVLTWPSVLNKVYNLEASSSLTGGSWTILGSGLTGTGQDVQFTPANLGPASWFFRVRLVQ